MSEPKLKPCPFCGERDRIKVIEWAVVIHIVWCEICHCDGPEAWTPALAITLWNRRAGNESRTQGKKDKP